ncbi:MAG: hypothetical protein KGI34_09665 [Bradyrhizobium sp.]|nr:hypothetical protein [Bradyrhizobium sp.]
MSIEELFDSPALANMNIALDRVCARAAGGQEHSVRKRVAKQIIKCARSGRTALVGLTAAGRRALIEIVPNPNSLQRET